MSGRAKRRSSYMAAYPPQTTLQPSAGLDSGNQLKSGFWFFSHPCLLLLLRELVGGQSTEETSQPSHDFREVSVTVFGLPSVLWVEDWTAWCSLPMLLEHGRSGCLPMLPVRSSPCSRRAAIRMVRCGRWPQPLSRLRPRSRAHPMLSGPPEPAVIISELSREPLRHVLPDGSETLLERLQASVARQLAMLDDANLTGTGQSAADVLGVPSAVLADRLTGHLVQEILVRGSDGGPLTPLADQLNHDLTHLQGARIEGMLAGWPSKSGTLPGWQTRLQQQHRRR